MVLEGSGPSLIEWDWLSQLRLDWPAIHRLQDQPVREVLEKHKEGLGTLKGFEVKLQVDPVLSHTKYFKAHSVPYSLKGLVEEELDWLKKEGAIEPIAFSEWAALIVPVF